MENINEQFKRLFCELDLTDDQAAMIKKLQRDVDVALRQPPVSPRIDWVELRNNFFNECTTETPREEIGKKVNMAPHDLFEWFKREISEYVG
jgi:hypothetical protein